jgi:hypothetical protein
MSASPSSTFHRFAGHFDMLHDTARNRLYAAALTREAPHSSHCLDLGSGSGLLALLAAQAGAPRCTAFEVVGDLAAAARDNCAANALYGRAVHVRNEHSTTLPRGSMPRPKADLVVHELLDTPLIGEGVLQSLRHARAHLLAPGFRSVPSSAVVYAQLFGARAPAMALVPPAPYALPSGSAGSGGCRGAAAAYHVNMAPLVAAGAFVPLSDRVAVFDFDFCRVPPASGRRRRVEFTATAEGCAQCVVIWWDATMVAKLGGPAESGGVAGAGAAAGGVADDGDDNDNDHANTNANAAINVTMAEEHAAPLLIMSTEIGTSPPRDHWRQAMLPLPLQIEEEGLGPHMQVGDTLWLEAHHDDDAIWFEGVASAHSRGTLTAAAAAAAKNPITSNGGPAAASTSTVVKGKRCIGGLPAAAAAGEAARGNGEKGASNGDEKSSVHLRKRQRCAAGKDGCADSGTNLIEEEDGEEEREEGEEEGADADPVMGAGVHPICTCGMHTQGWSPPRLWMLNDKSYHAAYRRAIVNALDRGGPGGRPGGPAGGAGRSGGDGDAQGICLILGDSPVLPLIAASVGWRHIVVVPSSPTTGRFLDTTFRHNRDLLQGVEMRVLLEMPEEPVEQVGIGAGGGHGARGVGGSGDGGGDGFGDGGGDSEGVENVDVRMGGETSQKTDLGSEGKDERGDDVFLLPRGSVRLLLAEPFFDGLAGDWSLSHAISFWCMRQELTWCLRPDAVTVPRRAHLRACGIECPDLWRTHSPVDIVEGVDVAAMNRFHPCSAGQAVSNSINLATHDWRPLTGPRGGRGRRRRGRRHQGAGEGGGNAEEGGEDEEILLTLDFCAGDWAEMVEGGDGGGGRRRDTTNAGVAGVVAAAAAEEGSGECGGSGNARSGGDVGDGGDSGQGGWDGGGDGGGDGGSLDAVACWLDYELSLPGDQAGEGKVKASEGRVSECGEMVSTGPPRAPVHVQAAGMDEDMGDEGRRLRHSGGDGGDGGDDGFGGRDGRGRGKSGATDSSLSQFSHLQEIRFLPKRVALGANARVIISAEMARGQAEVVLSVAVDGVPVAV